MLQGNEGQPPVVGHQDHQRDSGPRHHVHGLRRRSVGRRHRILHAGHLGHLRTVARRLHHGPPDPLRQLEGTFKSGRINLKIHRGD